MRVWCLMVSIPAFQAGGTDSNSVTRSTYRGVVQLTRTPDLGSGGREFESHHFGHRDERLYKMLHMLPSTNWLGRNPFKVEMWDRAPLGVPLKAQG